MKKTLPNNFLITPLALSLIMRIYDIATVTLHLHVQRFPSLLKTHSSLFTGMLVNNKGHRTSDLFTQVQAAYHGLEVSSNAT